MIGDEIVADATAALARGGASEATATELRARWPQSRFVVCADDDVPPRLKPLREDEAWALYLIGGGEHCLSLTADPASAIGLVIAWREKDDC